MGDGGGIAGVIVPLWDCSSAMPLDGLDGRRTEGTSVWPWSTWRVGRAAPAAAPAPALAPAANCHRVG